MYPIKPTYGSIEKCSFPFLGKCSFHLSGKNISVPIIGKKYKSYNETKMAKEMNITKQEIEKYANKFDTEKSRLHKINISTIEWPIKEDNSRTKEQKNVSMSSAKEVKFAGSHAVKLTNDKPKPNNLQKNNIAVKYGTTKLASFERRIASFLGNVQ